MTRMELLGIAPTNNQTINALIENVLRRKEQFDNVAPTERYELANGMIAGISGIGEIAYFSELNEDESANVTEIINKLKVIVFE